MTILNVCFIAPIVSCWLSVLGRLRLHWALTTLLDQFVFSPIFNVCIFWFISAFFGEGLALSVPSSAEFADPAVPLNVTLTLNRQAFPSLFAYTPLWSTLVKSYALWLPATFIREAFVPPKFAAIFINGVSFVWNIAFALILAA
eukprot:1243494-Prymnesium_polylepis.1